MEHFKSSGIFSKQAHVKIPQETFEEEHGRKGFSGRVSHLYHQNPPVNWKHIEGDLKPQALPPIFSLIQSENNFINLLSNQDINIQVAIYKDDFKNFYRSADYDELFFIHKGTGKVETSYGHFTYKRGDYILIPRGTTYKFFIQEVNFILKLESNSEFEDPSRGILGPNALYDQTMIETPTAEFGSEQNLNDYCVEIKRNGKISRITYPFNPLDVKGWKGSVYPKKLSIYDICPIMSHRYHLPPSAHSTFVAQNFVVCSFVERPLEDTKHEVLKVPFYHSNIDYDEVLFYHSGDFFSRDNIGPGALTFHPQGIHHGPHPKAFQKANERTHTDEYAVMIDTRRPLTPSEWFNKNENKNYWRSWM